MAEMHGSDITGKTCMQDELEVSARARLIDWELNYRLTPFAELPWHTEFMEPDVEAAIARWAPSARQVIDLGTGSGTIAIEMARRGCDITALDLSPTALASAQIRAGKLAAKIRWLVADLLTTRFDDSFELGIDRGCLHVLEATQLDAYEAQVARIIASGGMLILKTFLAGSEHPPGTLAFSAEDIARLFAPHFTVAFQQTSRFDSRPLNNQALLSVLKRR